MFGRTPVIGTLIVLVVFSSVWAQEPTTIVYETIDLGSGRWQYTYDVYNNTLSPPIEEFTIWFGVGSYDNLAIETVDPPDEQWDEIVWDPEPFLGDDGGYDALAQNLEIGIGENVYGFAVSFDWLGTGDPGPQFYEIIDPDTFETIDSGWTIPEPAVMFYLVFGYPFVLRSKKPFLGGT